MRSIPATPGRQPLVAEDHVLYHRKCRNEQKLLMYHADTEGDRIAWRTEIDAFPVDTNFTIIGHDETRDDFHQRRLVRTVLAEDTQDLAAFEPQIHTIVGEHSGVELSYAAKLEDRFAEAVIAQLCPTAQAVVALPKAFANSPVVEIQPMKVSTLEPIAS